MSDTQLAAVRARLRRNRAPAPRGARLAQIAVGLAVMLVAGVLLAAARRFLSWPVSEPAPRVVSRDGRTAGDAGPRAPACGGGGRGSACGAGRPAEEPIPAISEPASLLPAAPPRAPRPARAGASRPTARARAEVAADGPAATAEAPASVEQPPPSLVTSRLAEESRLLTLALRKLRQDNDPAGALVTLDEHARRFGPAGALAAEADTARVEALLRLGRHADALVRLEGLALAPVGLEPRAAGGARRAARGAGPLHGGDRLDFDRLLARAGEHDAHRRTGAARPRRAVARRWAMSRARAPISRPTSRDFPTGDSRPRRGRRCADERSWRAVAQGGAGGT